MNDKLDNDQFTVSKFVQDFFISYDKNRHVLHTLFPEDGTFIVLGNRMSGHSAIQQAMLTMAPTTHQLLSIDIQRLAIPTPDDVTMFQVLCAGDVEFGGETLVHRFTTSLLVYFKRPNILNVVSFNERCMWPKLL